MINGDEILHAIGTAIGGGLIGFAVGALIGKAVKRSPKKWAVSGALVGIVYCIFTAFTGPKEIYNLDNQTVAKKFYEGCIGESASGLSASQKDKLCKCMRTQIVSNNSGAGDILVDVVKQGITSKLKVQAALESNATWLKLLRQCVQVAGAGTGSQQNTSGSVTNSSCEIIGPRALAAQKRLDALRLDYPGTTSWVCSSLKDTQNSNNFGEVFVTLSASLVICAAFSSAKDCTHVIDELNEVGSAIDSLKAFAKERSCPIPQFYLPC